MSQSVSFGGYRFDGDTGRLWSGTQEIHLTPKASAVLAALIAHAGQPVSKENLFASVWSGIAVSDDALTSCIQELRRALDDDAKQPRFIETRHRRGYQFVAALHNVQRDSRDERAARPGKPATPATRYAKAGDVTVAYQVLGDGPIDLVYVPGWITHLEYRWELPRAAHLMRRLASFSRLILFDKRGTGLSDRAQGYPTLDDRMDDVRAVMDAVRSERAVVFGASEGGVMSMVFAASHPDRTEALVLYSTFAKRVWSPDYPWAPTPEARQRWYDLLERGWGGKTDLEDIAPSIANDEAVQEWWSTYLRLGASPGAAMALARFNTQIDTRHVLPTIRVPTLILHCVGDREVNVEEARYLAARIPGAMLVELPGRDHLVYAADVDRVADEIQRFVATVHTRRPVQRVLSTIAVFDTGGRHAEGLADAIARQGAAHRGKVLRASSTESVVSFDGPGHAIRAACAMASSRDWSDGTVKVGIHSGECDLRDGTLEGPPLHIASALSAAAPPGRVLVTRTVTDLVVGSVFRFTERGTKTLGETGEWAIYEVLLESGVNESA